MKIGYYPGCSMNGTGKEYGQSLSEVLNVLGIKLEEINDWSCCGATSAHATNHLLSVALPARNLILAGKQKLKEIVSPCAACHSRMVMTRHEIETNPVIESKITELFGEPIPRDIELINVVELFERTGTDKISEKKKIDLHGIKAACYYGCLLVRPFEITRFDDPEQPQSMEKLIAVTGAEAVDWNFKIECCGGAHSIAHRNIVVDLSKKIIEDAKFRGADVIVIACPMCHSNLDMRQRAIKGIDKIPVLYLSEFIGLSLGIQPKELGIDLHFISANSLLRKIL